VIAIQDTNRAPERRDRFPRLHPEVEETTGRRQVVLRHDDLGQGVPDHQADPPQPDPSPVSAPAGGRDRRGQRRVAPLDVLLPACAGRAESRTAGSAGGLGKRNDGNVVTAPRAAPARCTSRPTPATGSAEPGFSKERRLDPQITLGLLTAAAGCPLMVEAFEGDKAETKTMLRF
jgi:hypothetical protein